MAIQRGQKRLRLNVSLPSDLSWDETNKINVERDHNYLSDVVMNKDSDDNTCSLESTEPVVPILDIGGGVFYQGELSQELAVGQEEIVFKDLNEDNIEENYKFDDNDEALPGEKEDEIFFCSSQHSCSEATVSSQDCSQQSLQGANIFNIHNIRA